MCEECKNIRRMLEIAFEEVERRVTPQGDQPADTAESHLTAVLAHVVAERLLKHPESGGDPGRVMELFGNALSTVIGIPITIKSTTLVADSTPMVPGPKGTQ